MAFNSREIFQNHKFHVKKRLHIVESYTMDIINFNPINILKMILDFFREEYEGLEAFVKDKPL